MNGEPIAPCMQHPKVAADIGSDIDRVAQNFDTRVAIGDGLGLLQSAVGAGIVHDEDLKVVPALVEQRIHRQLDGGLCIVGGHDDGD